MPLTTPWSSEDKTPARRRFQHAIVPALREGKNRLDVRVYVDCEASQRDTTIARGSLEIDVPAGGIEAFLATVPEPSRQNFRGEEKLAAELLPELQASWTDEEVLGLQVASKEWEPIRDEATSRLIARRLVVAVYTRRKAATNPHLCEVKVIPIERDVAGGSLRVFAADDKEPYPCAKVPRATSE